MRKKVAFLSCLLLVLLWLSGCGGDSGEFAVLVASGTSTSQWYPISAGICSYITDISAEAQVTSGGIENGTLVGRQDMEFGFINSNAAYAARNGLWPYTQCYDVSAVAELYTCAVQIVVFDDSGIRKVQDLRGKRVVLSPPGSSLYMAALDILAAYGLDESTVSGVQMSYSEGVIAMRDGHCDAMIVIMPMPNSSITELSLVRDVRLLPIDKAAELAEQYPYFRADTIPADTYSQSDVSEAPIPTVRLGVMLITGSQVADNHVDAVLISIFDHLPQLGEIQAIAKGITLDNAALTPIPLHPAAQRFYASRGVTEIRGGAS